MSSSRVQKSSEYAEDDDSASNSSNDAEKPPVSLLTDDASSAEAVQRLQLVLGGLRVSEDGAEEPAEPSPTFIIPTLASTSDRDDMFAALPDDCLAAVFRKLSNKDLAQCAMVCKWWFM